MKVLFDHSQPFLLAHGGFQIQIEQTKAALESIGVSVEFLRWWDASQTSDVIHYFGRPPEAYAYLVHQKERALVMTDLLGGLGSRGAAGRVLQRCAMQLSRRLVPRSMLARLAWGSFQDADAIIALTPWEARLMEQMFNAPSDRMSVVPNGVEEVFLTRTSEPRGRWLICTATIFEVKRTVELAEAAISAKVPVWFIGKPYNESAEYTRRFCDIAKRSPDLIRYEGAVSDRSTLARAYRQARGFVLLSRWETLSLAALEAAACECPLLLADLPWAHSVFGDRASYCPVPAGTTITARHLKSFYDAAPTLPCPDRPKTWREVAVQLRDIYERVLKTSR